MKKIFQIFLVGIFSIGMLFPSGVSQAQVDYNGKIVKINTSDALYYIANESTRYVFPSSKIFKSWFPDFTDVVQIPIAELSAIPLKGNVLYRPGVVLVKIQTDPKIYAVSKGGVLRWVKTEAVARGLYGDNWNLLVDDVPDSFFVNYQIGDAIGNFDDFVPDSEIEAVKTINANRGLSQGNAVRARTLRCQILGSVKSRDCTSSIAVTEPADNDDDVETIDYPYITKIEVANGGEVGYIDVDDTITVTFSEEIDPTSIDNLLTRGGFITDVNDSRSGGVRVSSSGKVTIKNIASFEMGDVDFSENFRSKLSLSSNGKVLTITLTSGSDLEIINENFDDAKQVAGFIKDVDGNKMKNDNISSPTGTFGGDNEDSPEITKMEVFNGGESGYIDVGDKIEITFSESIDPNSIDNDLKEGDKITGVPYSRTGGVRVSSSGKVTINDIAAFNIGDVDSSETFTVKIALGPRGKVLTITLTDGSDVEIINEDFKDTSQTGGVIKDLSGNEMESDSDIDEPTGTFGGNSSNSSGDPYITKIEVSDEGQEGFIDVGDEIKITFNEAIDPNSINSGLVTGNYVTDIPYTSTGGIKVTSSGTVMIEDIATFEMGSVAYSESFIVKIALSSTGKILTITLMDGGDVEIIDEDFDVITQIAGVVEDEDGNKMEGDIGAGDLIGTFGGNFDGYNDNNSNPYIVAINVSNGGESGYIDTGDSIALTFNEAIDPDSIDSQLDEGDYITGVSYSDTGGVRVSSSGKITINNIAAFDIGDVEDSETFTSKVGLSANGKVLTITLTAGSNVEIENEDFSDTSQTGGIIEDMDGNEMDSDSSILDPTGTFGGQLNNDGSGNLSITRINISNGGQANYVDVGDKIEVTFSEEVDSESINGALKVGGSVSNILYSMTGGVNIFSAGGLIIEGIGVLDVGSVDRAGIFTSSLTLDADGEILTITLTGGSSVKITSQDLDGISQTGDKIKNKSGAKMKDSSLSNPRGSF